MISEDWATEQRKLRIEMAQNQVRMEIADEELPRGGNPIATLAVVVLVLMVSASCMVWGYTFYKAIDAPVYVSTTPSYTSIVLHERELGQRK